MRRNGRPFTEIFLLVCESFSHISFMQGQATLAGLRLADVEVEVEVLVESEAVDAGILLAKSKELKDDR